jgi:hypothetical protein
MDIYEPNNEGSTRFQQGSISTKEIHQDADEFREIIGVIAFGIRSIGRGDQREDLQNQQNGLEQVRRERHVNQMIH